MRHLSLLRLRDFRCLALAILANSVGMMGELVVLGWLTLELTSSPLLVGVALATRGIPLLLVGVPAGVLADRLPRHRLLVATSLGQALTSALLGLLALLGVVRLPHLLLLTFAAGSIRAIEQAARQSYTHDIVGATDLLSGLAILGVVMRLGWLLGSLASGAFLAGLGSGVAYLAVAAGYLGSAGFLLPARAMASEAPSRSGSLWQGLTGFVAAIRGDRALPALITLTAAAEMLGFSHQTLLPSLARDVLHVGPEGLGAMNAARAGGGILGILVVSGLGLVNGSGALFLGVLCVFGGSLVTLALAPGFGSVLAILLLVNGIGALSDLLSQSLMQLSVPGHLRGRAGGAWVVAIGLGPLGQLQVGALASLLGVSAALALSGLGLLVLGAAAAVFVPRLRSL